MKCINGPKSLWRPGLAHDCPGANLAAQSKLRHRMWDEPMARRYQTKAILPSVTHDGLGRLCWQENRATKVMNHSEVVVGAMLWKHNHGAFDAIRCFKLNSYFICCRAGIRGTILRIRLYMIPQLFLVFLLMISSSGKKKNQKSNVFGMSLLHL